MDELADPNTVLIFGRQDDGYGGKCLVVIPSSPAIRAGTELTHAEIAQRAGVSPRTVKRAIQKLTAAGRSVPGDPVEVFDPTEFTPEDDEL